MSELMRRDPSSAPAAYEQPRPENIWIDGYLDEKESQYGRYLQMVLRRKWLVLAVALVVLAGPRTGRTNAAAYSRRCGFSSIPNRTFCPTGTSMTRSPRTPVWHEAQVFKSEVLARRIVTRLDPLVGSRTKQRGGRDSCDESDSDADRGDAGRGSQLHGGDPGYAAAAINALADEYVDYSFETKHDATTRARDLLGKELAQAAAEAGVLRKATGQLRPRENILFPRKTTT